jgi:hypothetical protein
MELHPLTVYLLYATIQAVLLRLCIIRRFSINGHVLGFFSTVAFAPVFTVLVVFLLVAILLGHAEIGDSDE